MSSSYYEECQLITQILQFIGLYASTRKQLSDMLTIKKNLIGSNTRLSFIAFLQKFPKELCGSKNSDVQLFFFNTDDKNRQFAAYNLLKEIIYCLTREHIKKVV